MFLGKVVSKRPLQRCQIYFRSVFGRHLRTTSVKPEITLCFIIVSNVMCGRVLGVPIYRQLKTRYFNQLYSNALEVYTSCQDYFNSHYISLLHYNPSSPCK